MIRFADRESQPLVRRMWEICFNDTEEFMDLYFSTKYRNENTLVYFEDGEAVASLQMLPYEMRFYGELIPISYISGACTLPEHRRKGYMEKLLIKAFEVIRERDIPLTTLIPAEKWLYGFYEKYGYERVFERHGEMLDIDRLVHRYTVDAENAYALFDKEYQQYDFTVLKSSSDFVVIMQEYLQSGCPAKVNLSGMARVVDAKRLLELYAVKNVEKDFMIKVSDPVFSDISVYHIKNGLVIETQNVKVDIETDVCLLTRLLMGFRMNELPQYSEWFLPHNPVMNLMLE